MFTDRWYQTEAVESVGPYYAGDMQGRHPLIGLPTGTGKGLVIARLIQMIMRHYPWHRIIALTHVKKLIEQNSKKLIQVWDTAPIGICSAGLNQRDTAQPIIFGGIQTVVGNPGAFGHRDAVIIDEAHLVSDKESTSYVKFINGLRLINPNLTVIGLSATLYRMKMGSLLDNGLFTDVAYNKTDLAGFNQLLADGHICPLIPQPTETTFDMSGVAKTGGEYAQGAAQAAVDTDRLVQACCEEMVSKAWDRHCCMVFAQGIEHAEHIAQVLTSLGQTAAAVHSKKKESDWLLDEFFAGRIKWIINFGQLTTGLDHPPIDFIGMMRATLSPGLWVQMLGRGTRPYDGRLMNQYIRGFEYIKANCLVLDFAGNALKLGPINDPVLPRAPGKGGGDAPIKLCEAYVSGRKCKTYNHASARFCCLCGNGFEIGGAVLMAQAGTTELIKGDAKPPEIKMIDVSYVLYSLVEKHGSPPMMRVSYFCGLRKFDEIVCLEHKTQAKHFASEWWKQRYVGPIPATTEQGLIIAKSGALPAPKRIRVWLNNLPYPKVMYHEY